MKATVALIIVFLASSLLPLSEAAVSMWASAENHAAAHTAPVASNQPTSSCCSQGNEHLPHATLCCADCPALHNDLPLFGEALPRWPWFFSEPISMPAIFLPLHLRPPTT